MKPTVLLRHLIADVYSRRLHIFDEPVSFTEYSIIIKQVKSFNPDASFEFILSKYLFYIKLFDSIKFNKKGILKMTTDLNIFSLTQLKVEYYLDRGWSLADSKNILSNRQNILSLDSIIKRKNIDLDSAIFLRQSIINKQNISRDNNTEFKENRKNNCTLRYSSYLNKINPETGNFYSEYEAKEIVTNIQKSRSAKINESKKARNSYNSIRTYAYYINKGFSPSEANMKLSNIQGTNTLSYYINKYGEVDGPSKFKERQIARLNTINSKSPEEISKIRRKQCTGLKFYSNASFKVFNNLIDIFEYNNIKGLTYIYGKDEYSICTNGKCYYYDFYIPELKFVIEFNGIKYHPNKSKLSSLEWENWSNPFTNESADSVYAKDINKLDQLTTNNIDYFIIWETDDINIISEQLISILKSKIKKQKV
jgi:hypothetical protein